MKKWIGILIVVIVVGLAALVFLNLRRPAPHAADLLPADTLVFVQVPDFRRAQDAFQHTAAYGLWQEPDVQAMLTIPRRYLAEMFGQKDTARFTDTLDRALTAPQGEMFLAVTYFAPWPIMRVGLCCGVDVKLKAVETRLALANLERNIRKANPDPKLDSKNFRGTDYMVWQMRPTTAVCYGFFNSMLIVTLGEDVMRDAITRFHGQADPHSPALSAQPQFQAFGKQLPVGRDLLTYINPTPLTTALGPLLALMGQRPDAMRDLTSIQTTGLSLSFENQIICQTSLTTYRDASHIPAPPTTRQSLALTSPDTLLYSVRSVQVAALYDSFTQLLLLRPELSVGFAAFDRALRVQGLNLRDNLLAKLGPETALLVSWREGAELPDVAVAFEVHDAAALRDTLDRAMNLLKLQVAGNDDRAPWDERAVQGQVVRAFHIGDGKVAPTYVLTDKFLILTLDPDYAHELLTHSQPGQPTLANHPAYQKATAQLPANGSAYSYWDWPVLYQRTYAFIQTEAARVVDAMAGKQAKAGLPLGEMGQSALLFFQKFPKPATVTHHLFPYAAATVDTPDHKLSVSYSPLGTPIGMLALAAGTVVVPHIISMFTQPVSPPTSPKRSSSTPTHPAPRGNQTAPSQTPATP